MTIGIGTMHASHLSTIASAAVAIMAVSVLACFPLDAISATGSETPAHAETRFYVYQPNPEFPKLVDFLPQPKNPTAVPPSAAKDCFTRRRDSAFGPVELARQHQDLLGSIDRWGKIYIPSCFADQTYVLMRWQEANGLSATGLLTQTDVDMTKEVMSNADGKWRAALQNRTTQRDAQLESITYKSFFGIPLGEARDFYRTNYSGCARLQRCVGNRKDITGEWSNMDDNVDYVVLTGEIVPSWLFSNTWNLTVSDGFGWVREKRNVPFKPIPERWSRLHGVEFGAYKAAAIEAFNAKYGQPVRNQETRTSSERRSGGGLGNPETVRRLSEPADVFVWRNSAVVAELSCFSDNKCDGVIVTKDYWPEFSEQRKRNRGNL